MLLKKKVVLCMVILTNFLSDIIFVTFKKFRHFCPTLLPIRYFLKVFLKKGVLVITNLLTWSSRTYLPKL